MAHSTATSPDSASGRNYFPASRRSTYPDDKSVLDERDSQCSLPSPSATQEAANSASDARREPRGRLIPCPETFKPRTVDAYATSSNLTLKNDIASAHFTEVGFGNLRHYQQEVDISLGRLWKALMADLDDVEAARDGTPVIPVLTLSPRPDNITQGKGGDPMNELNILQQLMSPPPVAGAPNGVETGPGVQGNVTCVSSKDRAAKAFVLRANSKEVGFSRDRPSPVQPDAITVLEEKLREERRRLDDYLRAYQRRLVKLAWQRFHLAYLDHRRSTFAAFQWPAPLPFQPESLADITTRALRMAFDSSFLPKKYKNSAEALDRAIEACEARYQDVLNGAWGQIDADIIEGLERLRDCLNELRREHD